MIKTVTIFDLETTGLDSESFRVIEFGAILYSVEYGAILSQVSSLETVEANEAFHINSIESEWTKEMHEVSNISQTLLELFVNKSDYVIAHSKDFDMRWKYSNTLSKPWLCTYNDFLWPKNNKPSSLVQTALNHGVAVTSAHRALTDCLLIASLFNTFSERGELQILFNKAIERANDVIVTILSYVSYEEREKAKENGFKWDAINKRWFKKMRSSDVESQSKAWNFEWEKELDVPVEEVNTEWVF